MRPVALDSSAVVAWVMREQGWRAIDTIFRRVPEVVLPGPALTEVIDVSRRRGNRTSPRQLSDAIRAQGVRIEPNDLGDLVRAAELAELSRLHPGPADPRVGAMATLSLGDTLILAAVERLGAPVVSRDGYWLWLRQQGLIQAEVVGF